MTLPSMWRCLAWAGLLFVTMGDPGLPQAAVAIPASLRKALEKQGCRVPAPPPLEADASAAISFVAYRAPILTADHSDWVVICERDGTRMAYVYLAPVSASSRPFAKLTLSGWSAGDEGCEGWIMVAGPDWIGRLRKDPAAMRRARISATEKEMPLHAGIRDGVCDGGERFVWYWTGRRWVRIAD